MLRSPHIICFRRLFSRFSPKSQYKDICFRLAKYMLTFSSTFCQHSLNLKRSVMMLSLGLRWFDINTTSSFIDYSLGRIGAHRFYNNLNPSVSSKVRKRDTNLLSGISFAVTYSSNCSYHTSKSSFSENEGLRLCPMYWSPCYTRTKWSFRPVILPPR